MRTNANAVTGHELVAPHLDLEAVRDWAKRVFPKEMIAEAGVAAATLVLLGYLGSVVYQGLQTFTMVGL